MADNNKTTALIAIKVGDTIKRVVIEDVDFSESRNKLGLQVGTIIVDSIFAAAEEDERG